MLVVSAWVLPKSVTLHLLKLRFDHQYLFHSYMLLGLFEVWLCHIYLLLLKISWYHLQKHPNLIE